MKRCEKIILIVVIIMILIVGTIITFDIINLNMGIKNHSENVEEAKTELNKETNVSLEGLEKKIREGEIKEEDYKKNRVKVFKEGLKTESSQINEGTNDAINELRQKLESEEISKEEYIEELKELLPKEDINLREEFNAQLDVKTKEQ